MIWSLLPIFWIVRLLGNFYRQTKFTDNYKITDNSTFEKSRCCKDLASKVIRAIAGGPSVPES